MSELDIDQIDEIFVRTNFLKEVFHILVEAREMKSLKLINFDTILMEAERRLEEIEDILDGKSILPRNDEMVFGMNP